MRLYRPYVPMETRCRVALKQLGELWPDAVLEAAPNRSKLLAGLLERLGRLLSGGDGAKLELHHRPSLVNRMQRRNGDYNPPANDPEHLVYLLKADHDVETRIRGLNGQHSDLALARKRKRKERKAAKPKYQWPSRPMQGASRWPKKEWKGHP